MKRKGDPLAFASLPVTSPALAVRVHTKRRAPTNELSVRSNLSTLGHRVRGGVKMLLAPLCHVTERRQKPRPLACIC